MRLGRGPDGSPTRRTIIAGAAGFAGASWLAAFDANAGALAYAIEPIVIAEGVWMVAGARDVMSGENGGAIANVAILDTRAGAVVIDTGPSKRYGEALRETARRLTGKDIARVYLTHFHPDHVFGNQAFGADKISAAQGVIDGLAAMGGDFATAMYATVGDWMRGTEVLAPGVVVTDGVEDFGDRKLHLVALGGHTASDLAILDERSEILFAGDLVFLDRAPTTPHADLARWRRSLDALGKMERRLIVPGHGPAETGARGLEQTRDWLAAVEEIIRAAFERGLDITEALELPLPAWTGAVALARYEFRRSVMHFYPKLEAELLPRAGGRE